MSKTYRYDDLIEDKKLAKKVSNKAHTFRSQYRKNGPVTSYSPVKNPEMFQK